MVRSLQLQAIILRPEDRGTHHADGGGGFALAAVEHIPRGLAWHVFAARIDQMTPAIAVHFGINRFADFDVGRVFTGTINRQRARRGRHVDSTRIFAWHNSDEQATGRVTGNRRIDRGLNSRVGHALGTRRADDEIRLRRRADGGWRPRGGIRRQRLKIGRLSEVFRFIGAKNRPCGIARCSLR